MSIQTCQSRHMSPSRQRLLLAAVMSGLLLAMLDQSIVGTALPTIVTELGGTSLYVWVVTAYLVPATVTLPVYARLSDRYGRRLLLLIGMVLFLLGSALSALSQNMGELIGFRALQGTGAGALEGLSFILVTDLFQGRRSAAFQGAMAGLMAVSFIAGPLIGGFLTDHVDWRACFAVNLPIGIAGLIVVVAIERRAAAPVVPLRLLTDRRIGRIMLSGATATFGLYAGVLLLPRYFQTVRGVSATHSGLLIYPLLLGLLLAVNL